MSEESGRGRPPADGRGNGPISESRSRNISELSTRELELLVSTGELDIDDALAVLRSPFCSVRVAELILAQRRLMTSHVVRERLAGFRSLPVGKALNLLGTLPWLSLLHLAQEPRTPPMIKRRCEERLINRLLELTAGEKIALARLAHRPLFRRLLESDDERVALALLDNPRLIENDVLVLLAQRHVPANLYREVLRHRRWGNRYAVKLRLAESRMAPVPLALSALVQLRPSDQRALAGRRDVRPEVRAAAQELSARSRTAGRERSEVAVPANDDEASPPA